MLSSYSRFCHRQQDNHQERVLPADTLDALPPLLDFSSNDYLALSLSPLLYEAALKAAKQYGVGATGSRLLSGNFPLLASLETRIAADKGCEAALVMNSGFQANSTILASLLNPRILQDKALVFFDRLNHASLYQGVFLSKAELIRYRHNDLQHLQDALRQYQHCTRPKFIVTETLFGMDGDILPIRELIQIARQYHAFLYVDEAHATGIMGETGYGLAYGHDMEDIPYVIMGTFSKALGVAGAYIACPSMIKHYLINSCPGFIYSTAPSPLVIGAANKAWEMIPSLSSQRTKLFTYASFLRNALGAAGFDLLHSSTHIVPIVLQQAESVLAAHSRLKEMGILLSAIRPPSVPPNTGRLRITLNAQHTLQNILQLIEALKLI